MEQVTTLRPGWRTKMLVIIIVLLGFGAWGFYDAAIAYPSRGLRNADRLEQIYLDTANRAIVLEAKSVSVPEPADALKDLRSRRERLGALENARLEWLQALEHAWRLTPDRTTYTDRDPERDPKTRLAALTAQMNAATGNPKPLTGYDILVQWIICIGSWIGAILAILLVLRISLRKYRYDPAAHRLTFPDGTSITPADLEEVDKRKWSKFFVHLHIKQSHPQLGGKVIPIDLYRRGRIEGWILEMESIAFPENQTTAPAPSAA